jgi:hypothetical protein
VVCETPDWGFQCFEVLLAVRVRSLSSFMACAVDLDDQNRSSAIEIRDEGSDDMLAPKLEAELVAT